MFSGNNERYNDININIEDFICPRENLWNSKFQDDKTTTFTKLFNIEKLSKNIEKCLESTNFKMKVKRNIQKIRLNCNRDIGPKINNRKESKSYRNRVNSQKSRDKKKELIEKLNQTNTILIDECNKYKSEIFELKSRISKVCPNCETIFSENEVKETYNFDFNSSLNNNSSNSYLKAGLIMTLFALVCIFNIFLSSDQKLSSDSARRILNENQINKNLSKFIDNNLYLPDKTLTNITEPINKQNTRLMLSQNQNENSTMTKENFKLNLTYVDEIRQKSFLKAQRKDYINKMSERLNNGDVNMDTCLNINKFFYSVQTKSSENSKENNITNNKVIVKKNYFSNKIVNKSIHSKNYSGSLESKVKSIMCNDYLTEISRQEKWEIIQKKLKNLLLNQETNSDCLYIHLLLPGEEIELTKDFSQNVKLYYEVGCKVFEINKIYI